MLDPSIPLSVKPIQAPDTVGTLGQLMQLQGGMQQMRLGDLQYAKIMQGLIDDQATKQAYGAYLRDPNGISLATLGEKNPKLAEEILKAQREQKKTDSEIEKNNAETEFKRYEVASKTAERRANILSGAKDQATYDLARSALVQEFGPSVIAQLPERFDPALVQSRVAEGMSLKDRLTREAEDKRFAWERSAKLVDQDTARFTAESGRISANASVTSAGAAVMNARTAQGRLGLETQKLNMPEGVPIEVTRKDNGDKVLVYRTGTGQILDANTRQPVNYEVSPKSPDLSATDVGKVAMLKQGRQDIEEVKKILFDDKGELKRTTAFAARASLPFGLMDGGFGEDGRMAYSRLYNAIGAKLRIETGAVASPSEVKDLVSRFLPAAALDNTKSASDKLDRLQEFMDMGLKELERSGYVRPGTAGSERAAKPPNPSDFGLTKAK